MINELQLSEFGIAGLFIAYLIYDRQVVVRRIMREHERAYDKIAQKLTHVLEELRRIKHGY